MTEAATVCRDLARNYLLPLNIRMTIREMIDLVQLKERRVTVSSGKTVNVLQNPSRAAFENLRQKHPILRVLKRFDDKEIYVWDAYAATHEEIMDELGLASHEYDKLMFNKTWLTGRSNIIDPDTGDFVHILQRLTPDLHPSQRHIPDIPIPAKTRPAKSGQP